MRRVLSGRETRILSPEKKNVHQILKASESFQAATHLPAIDDKVEGAIDDNEEVGDCNHDVHFGSPDC